MILESRDTISYALAAYSDFMASLDPARHKQEKALFVQLSFTKIYTYLRVRLLHHNLSSPLHRRQPVPLHHQNPHFPDHSRAEFSFSKKTTFKQSWPVTRCRWLQRRLRWGRPHRVNIALEPESGRESPNCYGHTNTHAHFSWRHCARAWWCECELVVEEWWKFSISKWRPRQWKSWNAIFVVGFWSGAEFWKDFEDGCARFRGVP